MRKKYNLIKLCNYNFSYLVNISKCYGKYNLPYAFCNSLKLIDYIAKYSQVSEYKKTPNTAVSFYEFDSHFDGINGLFNAIYHNDNVLLNKYKERFKGVNCFIEPDYSLAADAPRIENIYRIFKSRIVGTWLTINCNAVVIPNISFCDEVTLDCVIDGIKDCSAVCFNTVGVVRDNRLTELTNMAIHKLCNNTTNLKRIYVYSSTKNQSYIKKTFNHAIKKGIEIIVPDNYLQFYNRNSDGKN